MGRAGHPGLAMDVDVDFLAVVLHRLFQPWFGMKVLDSNGVRVSRRIGRLLPRSLLMLVMRGLVGESQRCASDAANNRHCPILEILGSGACGLAAWCW